jgi:predicted nucleic acid-binding protein
MQYTFAEYFNDTPQMYIMDDSKNHIDISAKIALKNGSIKVSQKLGNDKPFMEVFFDSKKRLTYSLSFCYSGSRQVAIMLRTYSFKEYRNLLLYLGYGDVETDYDASKFFIKEFTDFLNDTKNTADYLYKVYADLPKSFIVHIHLTTEKVVEHLRILTDVDDTGWFSWTKDTSSLLITVLAMFRDYDKVVDYLNENPKFVNEIYDNLDGHSEILGQPISNRILFASTLNLFTQQDQDAKTKITNVLTNYSNYYIESNILELNDTLNTIKGIVSFDWDFDYKDAIFLQQKRTVAKTRERPLIGQDGEPINDISTDETITVEENVDPGYFYNPMSPVTYFDKEGNSHLVTAVFIKAIADEEEWAKVMHHIRIGGDILAIIAGFMTMGLTAEFSVLAIADIGLAGIDLALMNEDVQKWLSDQGSAGKWFVENWDLIYAFVGAGIMSAVIMEGILIHGPALLERLKNIKNVKENYLTFTKQLEKLITELEAYRVRNSTNVIEEVVIVGEKNGLLKKLLKLVSSPQENLAFIVEDIVKKGLSVKKISQEKYEIFYKGFSIFEGGQYEAGAFLRKYFWKSLGKSTDELDKIIRKIKYDKFWKDGYDPDPTFIIWGSGKISHTKLWNNTIDDIISKGCEIKYSERNLAYGPSTIPGEPGRLILTEEASITALLHEAKHFLDDFKMGFPGMARLMENPKLRWSMEYDAYMTEIKFLRKNKEFETAKKLLENALDEKRYLEELYNIKF